MINIKNSSLNGIKKKNLYVKMSPQFTAVVNTFSLNQFCRITWKSLYPGHV